MAAAVILVVDDDANIRLNVRYALEAAGYIVCEASNGAEAMQRIMHDAPDLMLLDLAMPAMDGMKVLAQMRSLWDQYPTRVIVASAHGTMKTAVQAMQLGASDFLEKPFTPEDLRLSIAAVLQERDAHREREQSNIVRNDPPPNSPGVP